MSINIKSLIKSKSWLLGVALLVSSHVFAQVQNFTYTPQKPLPGDHVEISYNPSGTPLAGKKEVHAIVYSFNNYRWQTSDLKLEPSGSGFKASLQLDKNCGIAAFKFISADSTDNGHDEGYAIMTIDPEHPGINAAGAYAGWGFLRSENRGYGVPGYYKSLSISDTAFYFWMNNEIKWHPKEASHIIAVPFARSVYAYEGEAAIPRIHRVIDFLKKSGSEDDLLSIRTIYLQVLKQKTVADSLDTVMIKQFPKGSIARLKAYKAFASERNLEQMRSKGEQFLTDFPQASTNQEFDEQNRIDYANAYQAVIILGFMQKDDAALNRYINQLPFSALINLYYKIIEIPHDRKDQPDTYLLPYAQQLFSRMEALKNVVPADSWYLSPLQWREQYESYFDRSVLPVHINILRNTGHDKEALIDAERAEAFFKYQKASVNDDYAYLLNRSGQYGKLHHALVKSMYENQVSPEMIAMLKTDYLRNHKNDQGFDTYMNGLKNPELAKQGTADIKSSMLNAKMPDWSMTDMDGHVIKFNTLRGKTIVMDFWATWCVPCKASFPGMKLAVERYKNNPDVVFYFVDTEERTPDYRKQVAAFIKANHYPFHVLFDNQVKDAKMNDEVFSRICNTFQISGIPLKLVIDANGVLRFMKDGYNGSPTALADEISNMVEFAKKAN